MLKTDPTNATAMAYQGWTWALLAKQLSGSVPQSDIDGFVKQASSNLEAALAANPTFPDTLVFSSINAYWQGDDLRAKVYLARFDALKLPASNQMSQLVDTLLRPQLSPRSPPPPPPTISSAISAARSRWSSSIQKAPRARSGSRRSAKKATCRSCSWSTAMRTSSGRMARWSCSRIFPPAPAIRSGSTATWSVADFEAAVKAALGQ